MKTLPQACLALAVEALMSAAAIAAEQAPTDAQVEAFLATLPVQEGETRPTVAEFRTTVIVDAQGRRQPTFAEFRDSVEWQWVPLRLVRAHYPEVLSRIDAPKDLTFAFVLKSKTEVVAHAAGTVEPVLGERIEKTIERLIPSVAGMKVAGGGWQCFLPVAGKHGQFCAGYVVIR